MVTSIRSWSLRFLVASSLLSTIPAAADDTEGVVRLNRPENQASVRISYQTPGATTVRGQSADESISQVNYCPHGEVAGQPCPQCPAPAYPCPEYEEGCYCGNGAFGEWLHMQCAMHRARKEMTSHALHDAIEADCQEKWRWFRCKFGYFIPTGACGKGAPPIGHYGIVYPVDPGYFDQRDGQVYGAHGYGGPVSVPLAPVVNHTYNYGWGIPSSRLTPVLHPANPAQTSMIPYPGMSAPVAR